MRKSTGFCFLAAVCCLVASSPTITHDEVQGSNTEEILNTFGREMTDLRDLVRLLQEKMDSNHAHTPSASNPDISPEMAGFIDKLRRHSRDVDTSLSRQITYTNESDAQTEELNLSRLLLGLHSTSLAGGTVYTHWGRSDCPGGSELVYTGSTAGAYYSHTGSGSNYLCMPMEPVYDEVETSAHVKRGQIYSAEFETSTAPAFTDLHDQTPACAVCRAPPTRMTKLMVPGRNDCPSADWRLEYKGYLMSALYSHQKSEFICMDREAEPVPGTSGSQDGSMFYMVEVRCMSGGGLPCGPYKNGHELTCAVCTI